MFKVIADYATVYECQKTLSMQICQVLSQQTARPIGFHGGTLDDEVINYDSEMGMWFKSGRYENFFGLQNPENVKLLTITVMLSIPYEHDKRYAGVYLEDDENNKYIGHRGRIGGSIKGVGKNLFFQQYKGPVILAEDNGAYTPIAIISALESPDLVPSIKTFVNSVASIKEQNKNPTLSESEKEDFRFNPESETGGYYTTDKRRIEISQLHALVVNELSRIMQGKGHMIANTKAIDLVIKQEGDKISHLFEVKSTCDSQSIYTAIGQLEYHFLRYSPSLKKIMVLPNSVYNETVKKIEKLNIGVLVFSKDGDRITFSDFKKHGL